MDGIAHSVFPTSPAASILVGGGRRRFGDKDEVGTTSNTCEKREPPAVAAHDFKHKCTRMREGGGVNIIDGLANSGDDN